VCCVCVGGGEVLRLCLDFVRLSVLGVRVMCLYVCERVSEREVPVPGLRPTVLDACLCVRMCVRKISK